jgi:membrane protein YdbS with pleckstrin-like domain
MSDSSDDAADEAGASGDSSMSATGEAGTDEESSVSTAEETHTGDDSSVSPSDGPQQADPESVAASAGIDDSVLGISRDLDSTVRVQWSFRAAISALIAGAIAAGAAFLVGQETAVLSGDLRTAATVGGAMFALLTLLGVVWALLLYRSWEYVVRADSLYLSRGVFTRVRTVVPYVRVQHIDTTRNPTERLLGLSTLVVYTAGSRGADVTIPGLTPERASTLQSRLERLAIESDEEDAV